MRRKARWGTGPTCSQTKARLGCVAPHTAVRVAAPHDVPLASPPHDAVNFEVSSAAPREVGRAALQPAQ